MRALEAFFMELFRRIFGIYSIPFVAWLAGADVSIAQGAVMAAIFFVAGALYTYFFRLYFEPAAKFLKAAIAGSFNKWRSDKES